MVSRWRPARFEALLWNNPVEHENRVKTSSSDGMLVGGGRGSPSGENGPGAGKSAGKNYKLISFLALPFVLQLKNRRLCTCYILEFVLCFY